MICKDCGAALSDTTPLCIMCGAYQEQATRPRQVPTMRVGSLVVEYSSGRAPSGEWFALGSVHEDPRGVLRPASILVGTGRSHDVALDSLRDELERLSGGDQP